MHMITYKWSCLLKAFEHIGQTYFLSSLCVSLCFAKALELLKLLAQIGQWTPDERAGDPALDDLPLIRPLPDPGTGDSEEGRRSIWPPANKKAHTALKQEYGWGTWNLQNCCFIFLVLWRTLNNNHSHGFNGTIILFMLTVLWDDQNSCKWKSIWRFIYL